ncbi:MAG: hypothetical protein ACPGWR_09220 [Ardenticatenaceae bacterium]
MRVLPPANKQGCAFYPKEQARMGVLPSHEEILHCVQEGCVFYQVMNKQGGKASRG